MAEADLRKSGHSPGKNERQGKIRPCPQVDPVKMKRGFSCVVVVVVVVQVFPRQTASF